MEQQLYHLVLLVSGIVNLIMAFGLVYSSSDYHYYGVYRRSCLLTACSLAFFGIGFLLHDQFGWRFYWHEAATALSVTYFHLGGTFIAWSHTSLLNPNFLKRSVLMRDTAALAASITCLWTGALGGAPLCLSIGIGIFLIHVSLMSIIFLRTYYRISHQLVDMQFGSVAYFVRWMIRSCYLIITFGLGSIIMTALLPTAVWPYTMLLCIGNFIFIYIYYSIVQYGIVIDDATNATEDVAIKHQHT